MDIDYDVQVKLQFYGFLLFSLRHLCRRIGEIGILCDSHVNANGIAKWMEIIVLFFARRQQTFLLQYFIRSTKSVELCCVAKK